jgi:UDP-N-acetylmuramate dehydrogenase
MNTAGINSNGVIAGSAAVRDVAARLGAEFAGRLRLDEPMSRHTSWHAGGPADVFFTPRDVMDLSAFLARLPEGTAVLWVGLGSNLLVRDGGLRGVVVATHGGLQGLSRVNDTQVQAEAGVPCARIARQCVKWGLGPAEFFAGIPGTLGGALAMNAGAFGGETWNHVVEVQVMDSRGRMHTRARSEYQAAYRQARGPQGESFVAARLQFESKPGADLDVIRDLLVKRKQTQPIGEWSCGSVFTNPAGDHAARLIEAANLKGFRIGDASVSTKHANFIINHGAARAADLEDVVLHVQRIVAERFGVRLTPEVRIVGEYQ